LKLIFITGSLSGLGKGTIAASIATILQAYGYNVTIAKIDPYINVDAGLMNPHEHGEIFVLDQIWEFKPTDEFRYIICEVDQDFGTYERFLHKNLHPSHNITSGQIYLSVILRERKGKYLGKTVQLIPHVTDEIKQRIKSIASKYDITIVEVGGTVGDYEAAIFLESIRQLRNELNPSDTILVHVVWLPYLETVKEFKTKPAQQSFRLLLEAGLMCDAVVARIKKGHLPLEAKQKLSLYSNVPLQAVFEVPDLEIPYETLFELFKQNINSFLFKSLNLNPEEAIDVNYMNQWKKYVHALKSATIDIKVALIGKYTKMADTYKSIIEAIKHASATLKLKPTIHLIDSNSLSEESLKQYNCIILTPGFGKRGTEGMIKAAIFALEHKIPFLGICFGAQLGAIAFARHIMRWTDANSTEINPSTPYPVIDLLPEQRGISYLGGTMRLGGIEIKIREKTKLHQIYLSSIARERFRHRYHIIEEYAEEMAKKGFVINAIDHLERIAAFEVNWHPFFIGVQYHPEYTSRPLKPHPLFISFLKEAKNIQSN